ncbi:MAG: hypothetical protein HY840_02445 [Bacteroidetes bacterium]|nr:hypothetical protein [Bacteroidota bacterium]
MKTNKVLIAALITLFFAANVNAQLTVSIEQNGHKILLKQDTSSELTAFSGKYNSGNIYLNWKITNLHKDGVFLIYRSDDGINYEVIGKKQGIGVPNSIAISYYFTDAHPTEGGMYYKLLLVEKNNDYLMSDKIIIPSQSPAFAEKGKY